MAPAQSLLAQALPSRQAAVQLVRAALAERPQLAQESALTERRAQRQLALPQPERREPVQPVPVGAPHEQRPQYGR